MKVLLIGGAGFIGSRTALRLLAQGHDVVVADSMDPQIHGQDLAASGSLSRLWGKVPVLCGDTRDRAFLTRAMAGVEAVYYFPAGTGTGQSMYQIEKYCDVNVRGAAVFCEVLTEQRAAIQKVVVSSSRAVYGEGAAICATHGRIYPTGRRLADLEAGKFQSECPICGGPVQNVASRETDPVAPVSIYGISKLAQEQLIANVCQSFNIPAAIFRYQNVYGPGQSLNNAYTGILSIFTQLLLAGRKIDLFEDGLPSRDFVFIDDVVEFNVRALTASLSPGPTVLNVGSGVAATLEELVASLARALDQAPHYEISGKFRLGDIRDANADLTRLKEVLGEHQFVGLDEGVKQFVSWVTEEGVSAEANARFDKSLDEMQALGLLRKGRA